MKWIYDDGGRSKYYQDDVDDCVTRAIAIATGKDYKEVYDLVNKYIEMEQLDEKYVSNARSVVSKEVSFKLLKDLGFTWISTQKFGVKCKTHLRNEDLPNKGTLIASVSKHLTTIKDGIIYDTFDPSRNGTRCVYGYFIKES